MTQAIDWLTEHGDVLYSFALRRLRDPHLAEEAVQNTLLAAIENPAGYGGESSPRTWLIGILKFKIIDLFRAQQKTAPLDMEQCLDHTTVSEDDLFDQSGHWAVPPVEWVDPARLLDSKQIRQQIDACLARLPRRMAQIFWLRELNDEPAEQVCAQLGISSANLYQLLYRARQGLRLCLSEGGRHADLS
ncbi:sigma-70 family RNA polymerase sigma factor [Chitinibacter fontanus]|uniref:Sigma-70 family RNA polymerase sigma factor n=1 Tax=Chitinibacter fontanus TaxID=1737446 RepID=A0A7D5ZIM3_9NEIS|nr:sigma-70 family RNA polymerase sigma factor [Chitinibacter fontanus]QLI82529.1 sigma-70 family RNA polymerase sigma factor [Chitinibacter fontanus]